MYKKRAQQILAKVVDGQKIPEHQHDEALAVLLLGPLVRVIPPIAITPIGRRLRSILMFVVENEPKPEPNESDAQS